MNIQQEQPQQLLPQAADAVRPLEVPSSATTDDVKMRLTRTELDRARVIKALVEKDPRVRNLSDYEYAQWALTTLTLSLEVIQEKLYIHQCFRDEYKLQDNLVEGAQLVYQLTFVQQPGFILYFDYLASSQNYLTVEDFAAFHPGRVQSHQDFRAYLGGTFYLWQARQPNFEAIRNGQTVVVECMDATFANLDPRVMVDKYVHEFFLHYPKKHREQFYVHSPTVVNFYYGLIKRLLPPEIFRTYHLGYQPIGYEGRRLDELYNTPNPQAARAKVIVQFLTALDLRYRNEASFSLDDCKLLA